MSEINRYGISGGAAVQVASGYFSEGQTPSSLNDGVRNVMADVRRYVQQITPEKTASGSAPTYVLTLDRDLTAGELTEGFTTGFVADFTNDASATLNINSTGAKQLRDSVGNPLSGDEIQRYQSVNVAYNKKLDSFHVTDQLPKINADATITGDLTMGHNGAKILFGDSADIALQHNNGLGLILENTVASDDTPVGLGMRLSQSAVAADDVIGRLWFQANDEADSGDSQTIAAEIRAVAEGEFSSTYNATKFSFMLGASEAATEKMALSSDGSLSLTKVPITPNPGFKAYRNANQTITHGTWTKVALDTEVYDVGGYFDHSTNYRFTPLVPGYYQINAAIQDITNDDVYDIMIAVYFNGTIGGGSFGRLRIKGVDAARDFYTSTVKTSDILYMDGVDDYIELYAYILRGGSANPILYGGLYRTTMSAMLISRTA